MDWISQLYEAITRGDARKAEETARAALSANFDPRKLLAEGLIPAMQAVDIQFQCKDCSQPELCYVPEQMIVNRAIRSVLEVLRPALGDGTEEGGPRVVIGTVEGDRCDLGRDLVAPLLKARGFVAVDLGTGVSIGQFVQAAAESPETILLLYTRKLSSAESMKRLKQSLIENPSAAGTKLLVVGHHINEEIRSEIGADDYCSDVLSTIDKVTALAGGC
jgi:methanogenic corrinoid protein MtbC1